MPGQDEELVCWGCGEFGQNCHNTKQDVSFHDGKVESDILKGKIKVIACGASHTIAITDKDEIYAWGNGNSGQLGTNDVDGSMQPKKIQLSEGIHDNKFKRPGISVSSVACGGRHSVILLKNGNVYSFGNNFYAQLGYDFREKNYKENQLYPRLLKFLVYRPVEQVACGDKHTVFRFRGGSIACVGCNSFGQIGSNDRQEAIVPKFLDLDRPVQYIACGANHSMAVTDEGEVLAWGYGKACGSKKSDILSPQIMPTRKNIVKVSGGVTHSLALSASGNVYSWGSGSDGQLGFGQDRLFQQIPGRLRHRKLFRKVVHISCGEAFSAAVTENGALYMWGKNSHTIQLEEPSNKCIWWPFCVNSGSNPVKSVECGSWHAVSITGKPDSSLKIELNDSGESDMEEETIKTPHQDSEVNKPAREFAGRDQTKMSLAEFYAPTPDLVKESFSDDELGPLSSRIPNNYDNQPPRSTKLVVEVPMSARQASTADIGTSPIPFSSSESESAMSSPRKPMETDAPTKTLSQKLITESQELQEDIEFRNRIDRLNRSNSNMPKLYLNYDKQKPRSTKPNSTSFVQVSKSVADNFALPRENTNFTSRHIEFDEAEGVKTRTAGRSPDKPMCILGKSAEGTLGRHINTPYSSRLSFADSGPRKTFVDGGPKKTFVEQIPPPPRRTVSENGPIRTYFENGPSRLKTVDSSSFRNFDMFPDGRMMDSPILRTGRHSETSVLNMSRYEQAGSLYLRSRASESSLADYTRWLTPDEGEKLSKSAASTSRTYQPSISIPNKVKGANFALQISRSDTVVGPLMKSGKAGSAKISQLQRYANVHNPQSSSVNRVNEPKKIAQPHHTASIPGGRAFPSVPDNSDVLCVQGQTGQKLPVYSSAASWRDKADFDRIQSNIPKTNSANSSQSSGSVCSAESLDGCDKENFTNNVQFENKNKGQSSYIDRSRRGKLIPHGQPSSNEDSDCSSLKIDTVKSEGKDTSVSQAS